MIGYSTPSLSETRVLIQAEFRFAIVKTQRRVLPAYSTSRVTSIATGMPRGRLATPNTIRTDFCRVQNIAEQFGDSVGNPWLIEDVSMSCEVDAQSYNTSHFVERA